MGRCGKLKKEKTHTFKKTTCPHALGDQLNGEQNLNKGGEGHPPEKTSKSYPGVKQQTIIKEQKIK